MTVYGCHINGDPDWLDAIYVDGVYLHGTASDKNGYDIVGIKDKPTDEGVYDVSIVYYNGVTSTGKLFYWVSKQWKGKSRGLVVEIGDDEHMKDAKEKYERRAEYI